MRLPRLLAAALVLLFSSPALAAHPLFSDDPRIVQKRPEKLDTATKATSLGGFFTVSYMSDPMAVPLNSIHSWTVTVADKEGNPLAGAQIKANGDMPEHLHGMTTKPKVTKELGGGKYLVEGMNFHMPGWWQVGFEVTGGGSRDTAIFNLVVGEGMEMKMDMNMDMNMDKGMKMGK